MTILVLLVSSSLIELIESTGGLNRAGISCQTWTAKGQVSSRWRGVSSVPQRLQRGFICIPLLCNIEPTGRAPLFARQRKCCSLGAVLTFQIHFFHRNSLVGGPCVSRRALAYPDFEVYVPVLSLAVLTFQIHFFHRNSLVHPSFERSLE